VTDLPDESERGDDAAGDLSVMLNEGSGDSEIQDHRRTVVEKRIHRLDEPQTLKFPALTFDHER